MNKKEVFFLGFIGSEYEKHDLHQKSTSVSARKREETSNLSVERPKTRSLAWMCYRTYLPDFEDIWKVNESSINIRSIGF